MRHILFAIATALCAHAVTVEQYHSHDFSFQAQAAGNPFDVELTGEFTGPSGVVLRVPGFYDGDGTWKIRFSPTAVGKWSMRTVSPLAALNGKTDAAIDCVANRNPRIHGSLRVDPAHPYHFIWEDGTRYFLLGYEADWLWGADMMDPARKEMRKLIDQMDARGFNHVLVNVYAHDTKWANGKQHEWDYGPPAMFVFEGTNDKPDHTRLNTAFFRKYDEMMVALRDKGIVAHIMLKVYNKLVNWPERGSENERRYFRYVAARYQAFSNVVWDYSKEAYNEKDEQLQSNLMNLVRSTDAYRRLMTVHDDDVYEWDPELSRNVDFRTDQQHRHFGEMIAFDRAMRARPVVNSEFGYERGVDKLPSYNINHEWHEQLHNGWLVYMAGGYGVYYYHNTAWDGFKVDPEPPGMKRFQLLGQIFQSLPYWRMEPANQLSVGGPCLAAPGEAYLFYFATAGDRRNRGNSVNLTGLTSISSAEWINTWTGERVKAELSKPGVYKVAPPEAFEKAPAVLLVRR